MKNIKIGFSLVLMFVTAILFLKEHRITVLKNTAYAQSAIRLIPVADGLSSPLYMTSARDGSNRLFIVEQTGAIKVLMPGASAPLQTPFLNIAGKIVAGGEQGLLGLAFHPQYSSNGRFFVNYTRNSDGGTVVSEFRVSAGNPNVADTQERIIITIPQPFANHNGGWIDFGPDGFLYIGMGDGGSGNDPGNRAQNNNDLLGKMLRLDVNTTGATPYVSPATNPFFGSTPGRDEIYATGLRNPFRCSFDRGTGMLYAGDVGQGIIEEISIITLGGNYGWRVFEGTRCTNVDAPLCTPGNYISPIFEYSHTGGRCSVTGGYVYRGAGNSLPTGAYFFADFCTGEIFMRNGDSTNMILDTDLLISSFGEDEAGEMYVVNLGGSVHRLAIPAGASAVSAASFQGQTLSAESIAAGFGVNFANSAQFPPGDQAPPTVLAGASVRVVDAMGASRLAPIFYVSPTQINFLVPPGSAQGNATISFTNTSGSISSGAVNIANVSPGIFTASASGNGPATALVLRVKANGAQIYEPVVQRDAQNQFVPREIDLGPDLGNATDRVFLIAFGSGFRFRTSLGTVAATVGGTGALASFVGAQPDFFGLDQANILLPRSLIGRKVVDVVLTVDGQMSNTVNISIK